MNYSCGLDFGTTNSVLTLINSNSKEIIYQISIPSVIYFPIPDISKKVKYFVGNEAIEEYMKSGMKGRLIKSIKSALNKISFTTAIIYRKKYSLEELVSFILKYLKEKAEAHSGVKIDQVYSGRPVKFSNEISREKIAQERLLNAYNLAGFEFVKFEYEPIAAAYSLLNKTFQEEKLILICDLGGGTSDFSVLKTKPLNNEFDILSTAGKYIGGDNIDYNIMWEKVTPLLGRNVTYESYGKQLSLPRSFFLNICSWEKLNFYKSQKIIFALEKYLRYSNNNPDFEKLVKIVKRNLGYNLCKSSEVAKIALSDKNLTDISFEQDEIKILSYLNIEEFNEINKEIYETIEEILISQLEIQEIKNVKISQVFLTGGTSKNREIQDRVSKLFNLTPTTGNEFSSVSTGLAIKASNEMMINN